MIGRALKGAWAGMRMALAEGQSGWENVDLDALRAGGGFESHAGQSVTAATAMSLSAAWSCVKSNSQLVGSLPLALYEKDRNGKRVKIEDPLAEILTVSPNSDQTAFEFWESQEAQKLLHGNSYAEKLFIGDRLVGLRPLLDTTPVRNADGRFDYRFRDRGKMYTLPASKVFHMRGFGDGDGLDLSAIKHGVQSFGSALAADQTAGTMFKNGMVASGVLKSGQVLDATQRAQREKMLDRYTSSAKAGKIMTLEAGLEYQPLQINPEDAQLLETRRFQVEDVCRWFGTPPVVIGHAGQGQTMWGSGVEAIMLAWLTLGINPQLRRNEGRIHKDLIPPSKRGRWYVEWNREAMLQMDSKAKGDFLSKMTTTGIMSRDEGRDKLNMARRGGAADELTAQTALAPIDKL